VKTVIAKHRTLLVRGIHQRMSQGHQTAMMSGCPHPGEMIEGPDYSSGAQVEAGVAILGTVILWMGRPKTRFIQLRVCVIDNLVDRRLSLGRIPHTGG